ncbi:ABC-2 type transport system permease protein [Povalibacter uvarum]|uniref:ABC-2 type transport system permease protein n=1 Tax=Povalibacter uvarum TaxID=732238 RepID=A0A841HT87_9GAMM|nr:ABC transporter permease [Povalibacter uvarum]MBB6095430.1 ABC-2 type transport system permease protein [Povalibacter uvarum]
MSITTVASQVNAPMPTSRVIHCYVTEAKYAFLRAIRNPGFSIPTLLFPLMFYLLVGFVFRAFQATDPNVSFFMFCGFATMAAMTPGMFGFGIGFALEREQGLFRYKRAVPMPPFAALLASVAMSVVSTAIAVTLMAGAALALGSVKLSILQVLTVVAVVSLGAIPFCSIGLWLGSICSGRAAPAITNVIYIVLIYFSGLFIPLPEGIRVVVLGSPAFYLDQLALASIGAQNFIVGSAVNHVVVLLGVTVLFLGLATRRLAREG